MGVIKGDTRSLDYSSCMRRRSDAFCKCESLTPQHLDKGILSFKAPSLKS